MNAAEYTTRCTGEISEDDDKIITVTENIPPASYSREARKPVAINLVSLKMVKTIDPAGSVCGVALLKGYINILTSRCISVYAGLAMPHDHVKAIVLPSEIVIQENDSGNMAASEKSGCLYLRSGKSVWKFTAECDKAVPWLSINYQITSISAANDERILIGTFEDARERGGQHGRYQIVSNESGFEYNGCAMLHVYRPSAKVAKQFMFPNERGSLRQAIAASSGNIIMVFSKGQEVFEMNLQGMIVRSFKISDSCDHTVHRAGAFGSNFGGGVFDYFGPTANLQRSSASIAESGKGCIFIGYVSPNCRQCSSYFVVINSDFQLQQSILPNLHYDCRNFEHIFFDQSHSLLLMSCFRYEEEKAIAREVKLFDIRNA